MSHRDSVTRRPTVLALLMLTPFLVTRAQGTRAAPAQRASAAISVAQARPPKTKSPAKSPQEQQRRKLLEGMGLKKQDESLPPSSPPSSSSSPSSPPSSTAPPRPRPPSPWDTTPTPTATPTPVDKKPLLQDQRPAAVSAAPSFRQVIHPLLVQTCKVCHVAGGPAAMTTFVLSGESATDHAAVMRVVDLRAPAASALLAKTSGQKPHAGGANWPSSGATYSRVLAWVQGGARLNGAESTTAATSTAEPMPGVGRSRGSQTAPPAKPGSPAVAPRVVTGTVPPSPAIATSTIDTGEGVLAPSLPEVAPAAEVAPSAVVAPAATTATPGTVDFATQVHPLLVRACATCHSPAGVAAPTRLNLSRDVDTDYAHVRALVDLKVPARSLLITKGSGESHAGGAGFVPGGADYALLVKWITAGAARRTAIPVAPSAAGVSAPVAAPTPAIESTPPAAASPPAYAHPPGTFAGGAARSAARSALALPYGLALNGRFDLAYERRGFSGDPTDSTAVNALRSHHHFLFLSRQSADDPIGLAVEMISLQFWEAHYRWRSKHAPIQVVVAAGKIIVPFGAEPLMHQSYGGLAGFDQRILPAIWAQHGLVVRAVAHRGNVAITDDLFVVRGYGLRQGNAIINLQNDFSSESDTHLGWGNRLGAAWGPLSGWYSTYYNPLGFGRRLLMQAADVMLWRMRGVPVLGHFSFAAGLMRADVSGGDDAETG
ncbi:MAG: hypothetical protein H7X95_09915, partial [Deltaproteobacteria bacterium]|nr:hypothetical protein [Deltaproteobacteria bacterium]